METINISKAVIKCGDEYLIFKSDSPIKKWQFFQTVVSDENNFVGELSKDLTKKLNITQNPGKLMCEINYFENGKQYSVKVYKVKLYEKMDFEENDAKFLLLSELKTLKFENIDKVIFEKLLSDNRG